jgi:MFS family permease
MYADGAAWSLMVGLGETYIPAFALALGKAPETAALLTCVPMLLGAILQWFLLPSVLSSPSLRRWVALVVALQALCFVPLLVAAWMGAMPTIALFAIVALYWGLGLSGGPAWSTWIETLVPKRLRMSYFAVRTRMLHAMTLGGIVAGGFLLQELAGVLAPTRAFVLLFAVALLARGASLLWLLRHSNGTLRVEELRSVSLLEFFRRLQHGEDGRLLAYVLCLQLAVQFAQPLVTPFLLNHQKLSYAAYMGLLAAFLLGKAVAMPALARFAQRRGLKALLTLGGLGMIPLTAPWLLTENYLLLFAAQALAGVFCGASELATFCAYFAAIDPRERVSILTHYNVLNAAAFAAGCLGGAWILRSASDPAQGYALAFGLSMVLRAATLLLLRRVRQI